MNLRDQVTLKERMLGVDANGDELVVPAGEWAEVVAIGPAGTFFLWCEALNAEIPHVTMEQVIPA
jgi:hypothetical protein